MKNNKYIYPLAQQTWGDDEKEALKKVVDSDQYTMDFEVKTFESEFAERVGAKYAVMVNSGSSANLLCFEAMLRPARGTPKLQIGDEILVPALAWSTTLSPVIQMGLTPKILDIDLETLAISPTAIRASITEKTRALMVIHVLGRPAAMDEIQTICKEYNLILIEDCCESLGASYNGIHVGNFGEFGTFSFFFSHHISTIEGGMIILNDFAIYNELVSMRAHGWSRLRLDEKEWLSKNPHLDPRFIFLTTGYNMRPTEFQGALGRIQLNRLSEFVERRRQLANLVNNYLSKHLPWLKLVGGDLSDRDSSIYHSFMCLPFVITDAAPITKDDFCRHLEDHGIDTRPIIAGNILKHPINRYLTSSQESCVNAEKILLNGFMIGCHPYIEDESWSAFTNAIQKAKDFRK